jgi:formylglycine-generating enzyme required for sulfatase activity
VGTHPFDVTGFGELAGGAPCDGGCVFDMGWNVSEYMADWFQTYREGCWEPGNYGPDPVCDPPPGEVVHGRSVRGGYWFNLGDQGSDNKPVTSFRQFFIPGGVSAALGFRCVHPDTP